MCKNVTYSNADVRAVLQEHSGTTHTVHVAMTQVITQCNSLRAHASIKASLPLYL